MIFFIQKIRYCLRTPSRATLLIALFACIAPQLSHTTPKELDIDYYIKTHGQIAPAELPNVYKVFQAVLSVSNKSNLYWPELIVIDDHQSPSVLALKEGNILITRKALDIVYKNVTERHGDTRLAFILGHELSHIVQNDFLNDEIVRSLSNEQFENKPLTDASLQTTNQMKETRADKQGFLYAATAGYPVDMLLTNNANQEDFFNYWLRQTRGTPSSHHPSTQHRSDTLRQDLENMLQALDYFYYGERLSHVGNYHQAAELFQAFQKIFPSKEVLNNLGYCYIKMAMAEMDPVNAYHYWMPVITDNESILSALRARALKNTRSSREKIHSNEVRRLLLRAVRYLNQAVEKDPNHVSAYINLAVAHFYLANEPSLFNQHISLASAASEAAHTRSPHDPEVKILRALILEKANIESRIFQDILIKIIDDEGVTNSSLPVWYNLARLIPDEFPQKNSYWEKVMRNVEQLPKPIQYSLCESKKIVDEKRCLAIKAPIYSSGKFVESLPVEIGRDLIFSPFSKQELRTHKWHETILTSNVRKYSGDIQGQQFELLVIDDIVTMIVVRDENFLSEINFMKKHGNPKNHTTHNKKTRLSYPLFTALSEGGKVKELWFSQPQ